MVEGTIRQGYLSLLGKKIRSPLGIEEKAHDKAHINYCCKESRRIAMNEMVAKIIFALGITYISKHVYYLVKIWLLFTVILMYPLFHIKETLVCKIRPCNANIVLTSVVILE